MSDKRKRGGDDLRGQMEMEVFGIHCGQTDYDVNIELNC